MRGCRRSYPCNARRNARDGKDTTPSKPSPVAATHGRYRVSRMNVCFHWICFWFSQSHFPETFILKYATRITKASCGYQCRSSYKKPQYAFNRRKTSIFALRNFHPNSLPRKTNQNNIYCILSSARRLGMRFEDDSRRLWFFRHCVFGDYNGFWRRNGRRHKK